jgi:hypothetical protein
VSDTSFDIAMLRRDVMMPLPMREGWGPGDGLALPVFLSFLVRALAEDRRFELLRVSQHAFQFC